MSEPIKDVETVVRELGAVPVPTDAVPGLTGEERDTIAEFIGDAKPAAAGLLEQLAVSVRDRLAHDHTTQREDWFCMNLTSFMGERMGPVLRRLLDAEARIAELEAAAYGDAKVRLFSPVDQIRHLHSALAAQLARADTLDRLAKELRARAEATEAAPTTVFQASHDSIVMGLYTTRQAAYEHCEAYELRDDPVSPMAWNVDEDGVAELVRLRVPRSAGAESATGYVVTPLEVASECDAGADE